ncbi:IS200/IS605 family transposase [Methanonatronarchaeum sp. AMET-Sl]|uniref:IS200/IS605 family transposase n=1 Tax=Methanonatronarchaeum sp. AMET-Sl TaxID=3037654 RepID=UPI00244DBFA2|nr:IS200/IS605 family transposase [Methanonatronarchaeum sp. AMET-Sl]WGI16737.1 IS200/IS605 family transposase [Methanonatronarchaeum sp. AMET-Sl]
MGYDAQSGIHSKCSLQYHLILATRCRYNLLEGGVGEDLKEQIDSIAENKDIEVLNKETDEDHIHILFRATPITELSKFINSLKGVTTRKLRNKHNHLEQHSALWSPSYFLVTTGEVTLNQLKEYVEQQGGFG